MLRAVRWVKVHSMKKLTREKVRGRKDGVSFVHIYSWTAVLVSFLKNRYLINGTP